MERVRLPLERPPDPPETRLTLRIVAIIDGDEVQEQRYVFCPFRVESTKGTDCVRCSDFARLEHPETVVCAREPLLTDEEALELVSDRQICSGSGSLGARTPIGSVAANVVVCALPNTLISIAHAVVADLHAHGVVVVAEGRRPIALISRARLVPTTSASVLTLADCQDEAFTVFDERDSVAHALDRLVHDRQRAAVTIDAAGRVTGLVSDLEVLHWLARAAHGHMSHE